MVNNFFINPNSALSQEEKDFRINQRMNPVSPIQNQQTFLPDIGSKIAEGFSLTSLCSQLSNPSLLTSNKKTFAPAWDRANACLGPRKPPAPVINADFPASVSFLKFCKDILSQKK